MMGCVEGEGKISEKPPIRQGIHWMEWRKRKPMETQENT